MEVSRRREGGEEWVGEAEEEEKEKKGGNEDRNFEGPSGTNRRSMAVRNKDIRTWDEG